MRVRLVVPLVVIAGSLAWVPLTQATNVSTCGAPYTFHVASRTFRAGSCAGGLFARPEGITVVDPQRLGASAGRLNAVELHAVDDALALILGL